MPSIGRRRYHNYILPKKSMRWEARTKRRRLSLTVILITARKIKEYRKSSSYKLGESFLHKSDSLTRQSLPGATTTCICKERHFICWWSSEERRGSPCLYHRKFGRASAFPGEQPLYKLESDRICGAGESAYDRKIENSENHGDPSNPV